MVKTFIQAIDTHDWFCRLRQILAITLIFSMLAPDIAKAMEDGDEDKEVVSSVPLILKDPSKVTSLEDQKSLNISKAPRIFSKDTEPHHIIQFASQSSGSEDDDKNPDASFESTGSSPEKPQSQSTAIIPFQPFSIIPSAPLKIHHNSSSLPNLPTSPRSSLESSLKDRSPPLSVYSDPSSNQKTVGASVLSIPHSLEDGDNKDERSSLLGKQHRQNQKPHISIKQYGSTVQLDFRETGVEYDISVDLLGLPSAVPPSPHSKHQPNQTEELTSSKPPLFPDSLKGQPLSSLPNDELRILLIGEDNATDLLSDSRLINSSTPPPITTYDLPPMSLHDISGNGRSPERKQLLTQSNSSIQGEESGDSQDEVSIFIDHRRHSDDPDDFADPEDPLHIAFLEDQPQYKSCCGRPILPQHTKYTLSDLERHLENFSQLVTPHRQDQLLQIGGDEDSYNSSDSFENERSSSPNGSPPQINRLDNTIREDTDEDVDDSSILQQDLRLAHLPNEASSQLSLISSADADRFWAELKKLSIYNKVQLKRYKHQTIDDKSTWGQRLGKWIIGPIIGTGTGYAMGPVYMGGFLYLNNPIPITKQLLGGPFGFALDYYVMASSGADAIPQNAHLWKRAIAYLSQESQEMKRVVLTALGCILPSCVEPVYLITAELHVMQALGQHGWDNSSVAYMVALCPFLFATNFATNFDTAWKGWDEDLKESFGKLKSYLSRGFFHQVRESQPKPQVTIERECLETKLHNLNKLLFHAPPEQIDRIYEAYSQIKAGNIETPPDLKPQDLPFYQAAGALSLFFSLGDQVEEGQKQIKSLYETLTDTLTNSCLVLGSPARLLVLQFIGETIFGLFCPKIATKVLGWLFAIVGFPFQTGLEYKGMKNFFRDFIWEEEPNGHSSHPKVRITDKAFILLQSLIYILPLFVMCMQTSAEWSLGSEYLIGYIPFLIPEFATQATNFNGTYNRQIVTAGTNVHNGVTRKKLGYQPRTDWKKDRLIRLVQSSQEDVRSMSPELVHFFLSQARE